MAVEGGAEGIRRAVADPGGDMFDCQLTGPQQALGERHAPGQQIFHWGQSDDTAESCEESRARHRGFGGQVGEGPAMCGPRMHGAQGRDQTIVGKPARDARHAGDDPGGPAAISRTQERSHYQRDFISDTQAVAPDQRLPREQGGGERAHGVARG